MPDTAHHYSHGTDFKTVNPKGMCQSLQLDKGQIFSGGPAIVQCLADYVQQKHLAQ